MLSFEPVNETHLERLAEIYNAIIKGSTALFFNDELTADDMRRLTSYSKPAFSSFAVIKDGAVIGHAALKPHNFRSAYDKTAEITVILESAACGRGIGSAALDFLTRLAAERAFHALLALISAENAGSAAFFSRNGFKLAGELKEVGYKFGRFVGVVIYQKLLA
jgi:phosphinothricin acetyltransferase